MAKRKQSKSQGKPPPVAKATGGEYPKKNRGWRRKLTDKYPKQGKSYPPSRNMQQHAL